MNVVFFDVDGVLNSEKFLCEKHGEFRMWQILR